MKKIILFAGLCLASMSSFAQLRVDSLGKVAVGYLGTPKSMLSVGSQGHNNYIMSLYNYDKDGLYIDCNNGRTGINVGVRNSNTGGNKGINVLPMGGVSNSNAYGIQALSGVTTSASYGVAGHYFNLSGTIPTFAAGIYGSSSCSSTYQHTGIYAGYFNGDVCVTGTIFGNILTPTSPSTTALGDKTTTAIAITHEENEKVTDKLQQVQLLQIINNNEFETTQSQTISTLASYSDSLTVEEINAIIKLNQETPAIQVKKAAVRYGLAADQLRNVYPELVYEDADGNFSINYVEMIPLLVQSINELNAKIAELEGGGNGNVELMARDRDNATGIDALDDTEVLSLAQNKPNPFSERTTIEVTIPESTTNAALFIYDMNGKQVKQINITERGKTNVSITSEGLEPGMFLYSLIADGKIVSTKKMILTN